MELPRNDTLTHFGNHSKVTSRDAFNVTVQQVLWKEYQLTLTFWYSATLLNSLVCGCINLIFLLSIMFKRAVRTGSDVMIGHLVFTEAVQSLINIPVYATGVLYHWQSLYTCRITHFFFCAVNTTIFWMLFFLSVNRFVAVVLPLHYAKVARRKVIILMIVAVWFISVAFTIPMELDVGGSVSISRQWGGCTASAANPGRFDYRPVQTFMSVYVPVMAAGCLYFILLGALWLKSRRVQSVGHVVAVAEVINRGYQRKVALSKMLFASSVPYCLFFFASPIVNKAVPAKLLSGYPMLQNWVVTVYVLGHAVHPCFMTLNSATHRAEVRTLLCRLTRPARHQKPLSSKGKTYQ